MLYCLSIEERTLAIYVNKFQPDSPKRCQQLLEVLGAETVCIIESLEDSFGYCGFLEQKTDKQRKPPTTLLLKRTYGKNIQNVVTMIFLLIRFLEFTSLIKSQ